MRSFTLVPPRLRGDRKNRTTRKGEVRPLWRLAMVHDVDGAAPVTFYTHAEMTTAFDLLPYAFHATLKPD